MQDIYIDGSLAGLHLAKDESHISHLLMHEDVKPTKTASKYEYNIHFTGEIKEGIKTIGTADITIYFIDAKAKKIGYIEHVNPKTKIELGNCPDYFVSIYEPLEKLAEYRDLIALSSEARLNAYGHINKEGKGIIDSYTLDCFPASVTNAANNDLQNISQDTFGMRKSLPGLRKDILIITIIQIILLLAILVK